MTIYHRKESKMRIGNRLFPLLGLLLALSLPALANEGANPAVPVPGEQLTISAPAATPDNGISALGVADLDAGSKFQVMFDAASEDAARASIPVLAAFYRQVAELVAVDPAEVSWASVLFARNAADLVLTRKGVALWRVDVTADGQLSETGTKTLYLTIPHEQVHATQKLGSAVAALRWYSEGQATWAGIRVTAAWRPAMVEQERKEFASAIAKSGPSVALASWGGIKPKIEAILRQLTPEQRVQFLKDPSSVPGPFSFGPDDFISDESNTHARYGTALALFELVENESGRPALQVWFESVRGAGQADNASIVALALESTGVDIADDIE